MKLIIIFILLFSFKSLAYESHLNGAAVGTSALDALLWFDVQSTTRLSRPCPPNTNVLGVDLAQIDGGCFYDTDKKTEVKSNGTVWNYTTNTEYYDSTITTLENNHPADDTNMDGIGFTVAEGVFYKSTEIVSGVFATGVHDGINFTAVVSGIIGNTASLVFDGTSDLDTIVNAYNAGAGVGNEVTHDGIGTEILTATTLNLAGGVDADWEWQAVSNVSGPPLSGVAVRDRYPAIWDGITGTNIFDVPAVAMDFSIVETAVPPHTEGTLFYNSSSNALAYYNDAADMTVDIGQEVIYKARNNTGTTIQNGMPVRITGSLGNRPTITPADATTAENADVAGIATHDILNNADGYITAFGLLRGLDTSAYTEGAIVYLSDTPGQFSATPGTVELEVARVLRAHVNQGVITTSKGGLPSDDVTWKGLWAAGDYILHDMVRDNEWTMIVNNPDGTSDRAGPQPNGDAFWASGIPDDAPAFTDETTTVNTVTVGHRYITNDAGYLKGIRVYAPVANNAATYDIWVIKDPLGTPIRTLIASDITFPIAGWNTIAAGIAIVGPAKTIDVVMNITNPSGSASILDNWDYILANGDPAAGEVNHQRGSKDELRISYTAQGAVDRTVAVQTLTISDELIIGGVTYTITGESDQADHGRFTVSPITDVAEGVQAVELITYTADIISYGNIFDHHLTSTQIDGFYSETGYDNIVLDNDAYGLDILIQKAIVSPDWDIVSYSGAGGGSGTSASTGGHVFGWEPSTDYVADDMLIHENKIYKATGDHTSGTGSFFDDVLMFNWNMISPTSASTGLLIGGEPTFLGTQVTIQAGTGIVQLDYADLSLAPIRVDWPLTMVDIIPFGIGANSAFSIIADQAGIIRVQQNFPSLEEVKDEIMLANGNTDNTGAIHSLSQVAWSPGRADSKIIDVSAALGLVNQKGNIISAGGANLTMQKTSGMIHGFGINHGQPRHSNVFDCNATNPTPFGLATGTELLPGTTVHDSDNYDLDGLGVLTAIPATQWTAHRVYLAAQCETFVHYGQNVYPSLASLKLELNSESFALNPQAAGSQNLHIGWLAVQSGATDLSDENTAEFINCGRFGCAAAATISGTIGGGDVLGPASSIDNDVARFSGTTGKVIKDSLVKITDKGAMTFENASADSDGVVGNLNGTVWFGLMNKNLWTEDINEDDYAIMQSHVGHTLVNSSAGQSLELRVGNVQTVLVTDALVSIKESLDVNSGSSTTSISIDGNDINQFPADESILIIEGDNSSRGRNIQIFADASRRWTIGQLYQLDTQDFAIMRDTNYGNSGTAAMWIDGDNNRVAINGESSGYTLQVHGSAAGTNWTSTSNEDLKKEIADLDDFALERVLALRPVTWRWKDTSLGNEDKKQTGFVAEEMDTVLPRAVFKSTYDTETIYEPVAADCEEDCHLIVKEPSVVKDIWSIDSMAITANLVGAIKELKNMIMGSQSIPSGALIDFKDGTECPIGYTHLGGGYKLGFGITEICEKD